MVASMAGLADASDRGIDTIPSAADPFHPSRSTEAELDAADRALVGLGRLLRRDGYRFTTVTPLSHRRVVSRPSGGSATLRDVFGWSRPFAQRDVPADVLETLNAAGALEAAGERLRATVRFSTLGDQIFAHSAFPTEEGDAVFFGPDTYRFAQAIRHAIAAPATPAQRILDVGAGSGAGGLHAAGLLRHVGPRIMLTDINRQALRFSRVNAALNGIGNVEVVGSDLYAGVHGAFDLIISNPPYLVDPLHRAYRHGGGALGAGLSMQIAMQGLDRLAPRGRLLLYTGSAIVEGADALQETLRECVQRRGMRLRYEEVDPDVFGEELENAPYDRADRIAAVVALIEAP